MRHSLLGAAPATSAPANPFGGFGAASTATSAPAASTAPTVSPFAGFGTTAAPATSAAATTASSLYPSLTLSTAATSAAAVPSLFATAPSTLSTGSLFGGSTSTAASTALTNAASKNPLTASTLSTAPAAVALTPDTIAGSTKYTELPADAKTTLDQFHTFLQGQIHLSATLTARPSESLDKISKDTAELSKRLETLNDALERDTKMIGALQDQVVQEFKQADSAGRIIEAYANTSHANFLYAGNNSAGQCLDFEEQLRQYRSTIEEIERHLASYGSRSPQAPYALTEVLRNQHEGLLAIAGRVAALHDEIKDREKAYLMFRRKYFDDDTDPFQASNKHRKTDTIHHGHSLRSSGRLPEGQKSFREIAKETLRPGSGAAATAPAAGAAPAAGSSLFNTAPTLGSTSLFGKPAGFGASTTTSSAAPSFSLTAPTSTAPTTGFFGAPAAAPTTSLFGAPATAAAPTTSLFGAAPAASTAAPATGLFGAPAASAPATGLFGAPAASAPATGLFGAPAAVAPATGLFGAPAPATATPFGGLKLGGK
ncbi:Nucleoporin p58/p45 [Linnemannia schmuckeri]|uniref:Nucleoporin p58/p45 n=1 Tax=Linnemannia schmuckeri TaxID=64567 RepID=A0A9P5VDC3_9FUNG|nr:Nucleoporin p58/p45 [Linnemannia schmuckeri]